MVADVEWLTCAQRKIETECSSSEDSKKLRTAEAGSVGDDVEVGSLGDKAGLVMGECSNSVRQSERGSGDGSLQLETATTGDENAMSVDAADDASTAANGIHSSASDVIDVDAIDTETSGDTAHKDKSVDYDNPRELGLNEYYLQPSADDRPTEENVIDVDAESSEVADDPVGLSESAAVMAAVTSVASDEVCLEHDAEKAGGVETGAVGTERKNELELDEGRDSVSDVEVQNKELVTISAVSSASPVGVTSDDTVVSNKFTEGVSNDDATRVEVSDTSSSTEQHDASRSSAADVGEMVTGVTNDVIVNQEDGRDEDQVVTTAEAETGAAVGSPHGTIVTDTAETKNDTNTDIGSPQVPVEPEITSQTLPTEDTLCIVDTAKPLQPECLEDNEQMTDAVGTSKTHSLEVLTEENTSVQTDEQSMDTTDGKGVTDKTNPQLMEMRDKTVSDTENINQSLESADTVVLDRENVKESKEAANIASANVENIQQHPDAVQNPGTEAVVSDSKEMQQTGTDVKQSPEMICISPSKDVTDETKRLRTEAVTDEDTVQSKDVTDMAVNTEVTENVANIDENVSHLREVKHMAVTENEDEQLNADEVHAAENDVTQDSGVTDADVSPQDSLKMSATLAAGDGCNQQTTEMIDKVDAEAEAMESSSASDVHTTDAGCGKITEMNTAETESIVDKKSAAGEIAVSEASAGFSDGKREQEEYGEIEVEPQ